MKPAISLTVLALGMLASASTLMAQESIRERSEKISDMAAKRAAAAVDLQRNNQLTNRPTIGPSVQELRTMKSVDPMVIANRYKEAQTAFDPSKPQHELLIFVSTSMPYESLKLLARQASSVGAILVLRGFRGGLAKNSMNDTLAFIKPLVDLNASIEINPEAFDKYEVTAVPTFVIASNDGQACQVTQCKWDSVSVMGDVSLDYALEHLSRTNGSASKIALAYLEQMGNARRK